MFRRNAQDPVPVSCTLDQLLAHSDRFRKDLQATKNALAPADKWYPWDILSNLHHLNALLSPANRDLGALAGGLPVADIGAADGDLAFLLASYGFTVDIVDYGPTNWNGLRGATMLEEHLKLGVHIHETDLDEQFRLPRPTYGLVFFLGILYHLQNPLYALRHLAGCSDHLLLSTRVARVTADASVRLDDAPVAYLLDPLETNNDSTNWWIFSPKGLDRLLDRAGWDVLDTMNAGDVSGESNPSSADHDERAFFLLRSRRLGASRVD